MNEDQELLDRFAEKAIAEMVWTHPDHDEMNADQCYRIAIAMKQARDRICTTAKPAEEHIPPFPPIDGSAIPEKAAVIAAKRLGIETFEYGERS